MTLLTNSLSSLKRSGAEQFASRLLRRAGDATWCCFRHAGRYPINLCRNAGVTGYGMVSLASRWSGRDHNDEKLQSPDIMKNGAHVDVSSRNQYGAEYKGSQKSGLAQADATWNKAELKQTLGTSTQSALGKTAQNAPSPHQLLKQVFAKSCPTNLATAGRTLKCSLWNSHIPT